MIDILYNTIYWYHAELSNLEEKKAHSIYSARDSGRGTSIITAEDDREVT